MPNSMDSAKSYAHLISTLRAVSAAGIVIQPHDYPDPDAIAAAFSLHRLLSHCFSNVQIFYRGYVERSALAEMIEELRIPIKPAIDAEPASDNIVIVVDGCPGSGNVSGISCRFVGVIDHHEHTPDREVPHTDIRSHYGSTSTIITEYIQQSPYPFERDIATALMIGLIIDTAHLNRGMNDADYQAFELLRRYADMDYVNKLTRNNIQLSDIDKFNQAIRTLRVIGRIGFIYLEQGAGKNLLGILSDFFLSIREIDGSIIAAHNESTINISIRSEIPSINAMEMIRDCLRGIGSGGGHSHMAGGVITNPEFVRHASLDAIIALFERYLDVAT